MGDELGRGGTGFVMSATRKSDGADMAVKFMYKDRIPVEHWIRDRALGTVPREVFVLKRLKHKGIVAFDAYFEDEKVRTIPIVSQNWR